MAKPTKVLAKHAQFHTGTDLMGSKLSATHKTSDIVITPMGVKCVSKKTQRVVLIPWANIKGVELFPDKDEEVEVN